jgi:hypothetical protein
MELRVLKVLWELEDRKVHKVPKEREDHKEVKVQGDHKEQPDH